MNPDIEYALNRYMNDDNVSKDEVKRFIQTKLPKDKTSMKEMLLNVRFFADDPNAEWGYQGQFMRKDPITFFTYTSDPEEEEEGVVYTLRYMMIDNTKNGATIDMMKSLDATPCFVEIKNMLDEYSDGIKRRQFQSENNNIEFDAFDDAMYLIHYLSTNPDNPESVVNQRERKKFCSFLIFQVGSDCSTVAALAVSVGQHVSEPFYIAGATTNIESISYEYVGNVGTTFSQPTKADPLNRHLDTYKLLEVIKPKLPAGSCTMLMALNNHILLRHGYRSFELENAGCIAGCKCYVIGALTNDMIPTMDFVNKDVELEVKRVSETTCMKPEEFLDQYEIDDASSDASYSDREDSEKEDTYIMRFFEAALLYKLLLLKAQFKKFKGITQITILRNFLTQQGYLQDMSTSKRSVEDGEQDDTARTQRRRVLQIHRYRKRLLK